MIGTRLMYISHARGQISPQGLQDLAEQSARKNVGLHITGVLVKLGNYFFQVLEGPEAAVMALLQTIREDPRHTELRVVHKEPATIPVFAQWSMGCVNLDVQYKFGLTGYRELRQLVHNINESQRTSKECMVEILTILPGLLDSQSRAKGEAHCQV